MKKFFTTLILSFLSFCAFSASKSLKFPEYELSVFYPDVIQPGDAVFVRLNFECKNNKLIKQIGFQTKEEASLSIFERNDDKSISKKLTTKSNFYTIERKTDKKNINSVLLTGAPLSTWVKAGDYVAKINYIAFNMEEKSFELPIKIVKKEFVSETIPLNATNTAIKTNTSSERMDQINRLNKILDTKDYSSIYETSSFVPPNPATRRTSFFGDRRVFAYDNGKSSTSLHYGIDYGVPTGSEVRACGKGKVVMAEDRISTGWSVCIEHLPGLYSLYYHMSELKVEVGQIVNQGDLIGLSGATGLATGPHLHWEVRLNMEAVSPDFFVSDFTFEKESKSKN